MTVRVRFEDGEEAEIDQYQWKTKRATFQKLLNSFLDPGGPSGSDPDPDYTAAQAMIKHFGGQVISWDKKLDLQPGEL